jgi:hypothetical protein
MQGCTQRHGQQARARRSKHAALQRAAGSQQDPDRHQNLSSRHHLGNVSLKPDVRQPVPPCATGLHAGRSHMQPQRQLHSTEINHASAAVERARRYSNGAPAIVTGSKQPSSPYWQPSPSGRAATAGSPLRSSIKAYQQAGSREAATGTSPSPRQGACIAYNLATQPGRTTPADFTPGLWLRTQCMWSQQLVLPHQLSQPLTTAYLLPFPRDNAPQVTPPSGCSSPAGTQPTGGAAGHAGGHQSELAGLAAEQPRQCDQLAQGCILQGLQVSAHLGPATDAAALLHTATWLEDTMHSDCHNHQTCMRPASSLKCQCMQRARHHPAGGLLSCHAVM